MEEKVSSPVIRRLQFIFILSIVILLISSYASYYSLEKLIESSELVDHTHLVIQETSDITSYMWEAESSQRGYLLTGDESFLEAYLGNQKEILRTLRVLKDLTIDNTAQQQNLDELKGLIDARFERMASVITFYQQNLGSDIMSEGANLNMGKKLMNEFQELVQVIVNEENRLMTLRTSTLGRFVSYTPVLLAVAALISILITGIAYFRIRNDLRFQLLKQQEEEKKYTETSRRITLMEKVTRQLSAGEYSARTIDDLDDDLGRISSALNLMAVNLERNFTDLERKNWIQEGTVQISAAMRDQRNILGVAEGTLRVITSYLDVPVATFYISGDDGRFHHLTAHAAKDAPSFFRLGEGLLGQAAADRKILITDNLPGSYLKVSSSIGETPAAFSLAMPLINNQVVIGAMELGFLKRPDEADIELLEKNAEALGIALNTAINYKRMQELLEETQAQTEELQVQHNELENLNSELEAQSSKLQTSEEELKVQQEELQQTNEELHERTLLLEERNNEIQSKAEELQQSTKYKSEFLANMSHELRTPLNSILLLSRLLTENNTKNLNGDQIEYAEVILNSGHGLLALIDEILDLSRIEAGKMELELQETFLTEVGTDLNALFKQVAAQKHIDFKVIVDPDLPRSIETDKIRLEQILKNLIANAIKFTAEGSVIMHVKKCAVDDGLICFSVTDTGIGIPKEKQQLIFEAFQQADGSTKRKYGGTGLGLSITRELTKLLNGEIYLTSEPGKGSEFTLRLPIHLGYVAKIEDQPSQPEQKHEVSPQYISGVIPAAIEDDRKNVNDKKFILIVEDDVTFAKLLLDYSRERGYNGIVSVRGDEALNLARIYKPAGILLDIQLPVKSGWDVMDELKNDKSTRHIPVHIMSSHNVRMKSMLRGAVDFIDKPVAYEKLPEIFRKIEHILSKEKRKVLIIEDNEMHAKALSHFLETFGIRSEVENDIAASIASLQKKDLDCVILDMGIPDARAYDALDQARTNPELENVPIIIFTGKSLSLSDEQRIKGYADSIIVKTAHSYQRMLDEVSLFLHLVEDNKKEGARSGDYRKLGIFNEVLKGKTVLIADDDVRNIFSLTKALEGMKMNVITAINGAEALVRLEEHPDIDMVLLDMMMPELDGYETARRIRKEYKFKNLPIIAVTAKAMSGDRDKCIEAGASDYITKPVDIDQLLSLLRVWLYERKK